MSLFDGILILLIAAGVVLALRHKKRHPGCGGNCSGCANRCAAQKKEKETDQN